MPILASRLDPATPDFAANAVRMRERLAESDPLHQYIITVRGHGFRFENAPGA